MRHLNILLLSLFITACPASDGPLMLSVDVDGDGHELTLRWVGELPDRVLFRSGLQADFEVRFQGTGAPCWRWSEGRMFTMALITKEFEPDETLEYIVRWDGRCSDGQTAGGPLEVQGRLHAAEIDGVRATEPFIGSPWIGFGGG